MENENFIISRYKELEAEKLKKQQAEDLKLQEEAEAVLAPIRSYFYSKFEKTLRACDELGIKYRVYLSDFRYPATKPAYMEFVFHLDEENALSYIAEINEWGWIPKKGQYCFTDFSEDFLVVEIYEHIISKFETIPPQIK